MREDIEYLVKKYRINTVVLRSSFKELNNFLNENEQVLYVDAVNYVINPENRLEIPSGMLKNAKPAAMAVTNKRIIFIGKILFTNNIKVIDLEKLQTWNLAKGLLSSTLRIKTYTDVVDIELGINSKKNDYLTKVLTDSIEKRHNMNQPNNQKTDQSKYEELRELKSLLDSNIITQDEFNQKKKELLGL